MEIQKTQALTARYGCRCGLTAVKWVKVNMQCPVLAENTGFGNSTFSIAVLQEFLSQQPLNICQEAGTVCSSKNPLSFSVLIFAENLLQKCKLTILMIIKSCSYFVNSQYRKCIMSDVMRRYVFFKFFKYAGNQSAYVFLIDTCIYF